MKAHGECWACLLQRNQLLCRLSSALLCIVIPLPSGRQLALFGLLILLFVVLVARVCTRDTHEKIEALVADTCALLTESSELHQKRHLRSQDDSPVAKEK
jgi:hypothetical protein